MIYAILLLASLAHSQEVSTGAATSLLDEVRISNLGKDTRDLLSGRYRQTGKPTFANGFCFADGTCQTTAAAPTRQVFLSGSGTYTTPSGARQIKVRMVGGGGGGGEGNSTGNAGSGGARTLFGTVATGVGIGGAAGTGGTVAGGAGGVVGGASEANTISGVWASSTTFNIAGGDGGAGQNGMTLAAPGGGTVFGPGGASTGANNVGGAAKANSGGGGAGAYSGGSTAGGGGGGGGQYVELTINSPSATYSYEVGAGGAGGTGTAQTDGGAGGSGIIIVDEFY